MMMMQQQQQQQQQQYPKFSHRAAETVEEASVDTVVVVEDDDDNNNNNNKTSSSLVSLQSTVNRVVLHLTPPEVQLFEVLVKTAELYEQGKLAGSSSGGGAVGQETQNDSNNDNNNDTMMMNDNYDNNNMQTMSSNNNISSSNNNNDNNNNNIGNPPPPPLQRVEIRVAGGWVRDKLLRLDSHDVDIAVDTMTGVQFATLVQQYIQQQQKQHNHDDSNTTTTTTTTAEDATKNICKIGIIKAHPEQSKHLETACIHVCGLDVDVCHLRGNELYESHSRIPTSTTAHGTSSPLEDAERRDFCLNALFYNLRSQKVEDWTRRGLQDLLVSHIVETPLSPYTTFQDDPLRVLRACRFSVRLQYSLDPSLVKASMSSTVQEALLQKVSRERVGKELEGMLTGKDARPQRAFELLLDLDLADTIFLCPPIEQWTPSSRTTLQFNNNNNNNNNNNKNSGKMDWTKSRQLLQALPMVWQEYFNEFVVVANPQQLSSQTKQRPIATRVNDRLLYLAVFLSPLFEYEYYEAPKPHNVNASPQQQKVAPVVSYILHEGIKFKNQDVIQMATLRNCVNAVRSKLVSLKYEEEERATAAAAMTGATQQQQPINHNHHHRPSPKERLEWGLLLRELKDLWVTCLLLAAVMEYASITRRNTIDNNLTSLSQQQQQRQQQQQPQHETQRLLSTLKHTYEWIAIHYQLDECWKVRPLWNGSVLMIQLGVPRGPMVGLFMKKQHEWMLQYPQGTMDEMKEYMLGELQRMEESSVAADDDAKNKKKRDEEKRSNEDNSSDDSVLSRSDHGRRHHHRHHNRRHSEDDDMDEDDERFGMGRGALGGTRMHSS